ncbi:MAG: DUF481 domain-containing protein [Gammaproteobacteria bacterium]|nr:DUF481 domain-containing protein [Gammaproteobacteria bacterium]
MKHWSTAAIIALLLSTSAVADENGWDGKLGLGWLASGGNTDTANLNVYGEGEYTINRWHHGLKALAYSAETDSINTAERYKAGYKGKYDLRDIDYLFGAIDYEKDKFSGIDEQTSEVLGYGRRLYNNDVRQWNVEAGLGAKQSELRDTTSQDETIVFLGTDYTWKFSESGTFGWDLSIDAGEDNTLYESTTSVSSNLVNTLALVAAYTIKFNTDVPDPSDDTDTYSSISLEYAF